uniref:Ankyrin repeats (3 copies)/Ankyrin repeat/Ankyrin repeats (Many copies), putative n=1 Tax=Theileria annulata TaxID=5874 RepID=A0A3B0NIY2_THEAN
MPRKKNNSNDFSSHNDNSSNDDGDLGDIGPTNRLDIHESNTDDNVIEHREEEETMKMYQNVKNVDKMKYIDEENIKNGVNFMKTQVNLHKSHSLDNLRNIKPQMLEHITSKEYGGENYNYKLESTSASVSKMLLNGANSKDCTSFSSGYSSLDREISLSRSTINSPYFYDVKLTKGKPNLNSTSFYDLNIAYQMESEKKNCDKHFNRNVSFLNLRILSDSNDVWKYIVKRVEPFLDVYSILMLRQTCKTLYYYKYKLRSHSTLSFRGFGGFDSKSLFNKILPLIHHVMDLPENCKIRFDFTGCILLKDIATVYLLKSNMISTSIEMRQYCKNIKELIFDFCNQITDKSLEVMLKTKLPNLERLSLTCCRNEQFTGNPFVSHLSTTNWPKFSKFRCAFSNILLEPIQTIADFIRPQIPREESDSTINHEQQTNHLNYKGSYVDLTSLLQQDKMNEQKFGESAVEFEVYGSLGSRKLLDKLGFGIYFTAFANALKTNNYNMFSKLTKKLQHQLLNLSNQPNMKNNNCLYLLRNRGSELLVNCPITVTDRSNNNLGIWTLPIILVIQQQNMELFLLLIKRGARLNVWDSMNKSPLLIACELSLNNFVEKLLKFRLPPIPYDNINNIPLIVAITNSNVEVVKMLLEENFEINYKCPSIMNYKSPLYVACEHYNREIIELLLQYGADPNWKYRHRSTPTLLGYQQDSKILETFIEYGAGKSSDKRWVLVQVLACAIVKNDCETIEMLITRFPDLVEREHEIWSKPLIALSKLNKVQAVEMLLKKGANVNTFDSYGTTALHAACEESNIDVINVLLENSAIIDAQDVFGRTPLHLAVMENKPQVVNILLEHGASINIKEYSYGETPVMTAIRTRNESVVTTFLKSGNVDFSIEDLNHKNISYYLNYYKMTKLEVLLSPQEQSNT